MDQLVQRAISELGAEAERRQIEWCVLPLPKVTGDPAMLEQALINLISNALKYTRPRTVVKIEIGQKPTTEGTAIYIRDNGIGFNMKEAQKLFTPFHRLHPERQFEGSGVGLATVERIIRRHGGRIWAESKAGEGATFYFTLSQGSGAGDQPSAGE
jgi:signal transduction histidine kinase